MKNSAFNFGLKHIAYQKPGLALSGARTQAEFEVFLWNFARLLLNNAHNSYHHTLSGSLV